MSEVIEDNIEDVVEGDGSGSPSKVEVKKKKPYLLSPLRLEALAKAREKAFSLRKEYHDNKEPTVKKERIKKKSKLEVELENRELKKKVDEKVEVVEKVEKVVDEKVVNEKVVEKVVDEKVVEKVVEKVEVVEKVVVKTRPSFVRNENGFFCI